jgi:hypothetical protein
MDIAISLRRNNCESFLAAVSLNLKAITGYYVALIFGKVARTAGNASISMPKQYYTFS